MLQLRGRGTGAMMKHPFGDDKKKQLIQMVLLMNIYKKN
jgi:hypothetical protein